MVNKPAESKNFINLGVVLNKKGEVLLIRRKDLEKGSGNSLLSWAFPGGKQRYQETREACVVREIEEETGVKVEQIKEISLRVHPEFPVTIVYHLCKTKDSDKIGITKEPWEVAEIRWVKPLEIRNLITSDLDKDVSKELNI